MKQLALGLENLTDGDGTRRQDHYSGHVERHNHDHYRVIRVDTGSHHYPVVEVSIVVLGAIKQKPWVVDGKVEARFVMTIGAVSLITVVVDGDVASRFLADVASIIEEPAYAADELSNNRSQQR